MGNTTNFFRTMVDAARARFDSAATNRHNRPPQSSEPLHRFELTFDSEAEASLAAQVLEVDAIAVVQQRRQVTAVVREQAAARGLHGTAKAVHQPLAEASIEPISAKVYPSVAVSPGDRTWHTPSVGKHLLPDPAEAAAMRSLPAQLEKAGDDIPVRGHERLILTDRPERVYIPTSLWIALAAWVSLYVATAIGLTGTTGWVSPGIAALAAVATVATAWASTTLTPGWWLRAASVLGPFAVVYGAGILAARSASTPYSWAASAATVLIVTVYLGVTVGVYKLLRGSQLRGRTLLTFGAIVAATLGATNWLERLLALTFETGLGQPQVSLPYNTLDYLLMAPRWAAVAMIGVALLIPGLAVIQALLREERLVSLFMLAPLLLLSSFSFTFLLFTSVEQVGKQVRTGDLDGAEHVASCVRLGQPDKLPIPEKWTDPGVLVGRVTGPALFIRADSSVVVLPGGVTARPVAASECKHDDR